MIDCVAELVNVLQISEFLNHRKKQEVDPDLLCPLVPHRSIAATGLLWLALSVFCSMLMKSYFFSTRAIPHLGQSPGLSLITSECMGQVY